MHNLTILWKWNSYQPREVFPVKDVSKTFEALKFFKQVSSNKMKKNNFSYLMVMYLFFSLAQWFLKSILNKMCFLSMNQQLDYFQNIPLSVEQKPVCCLPLNLLSLYVRWYVEILYFLYWLFLPNLQLRLWNPLKISWKWPPISTFPPKLTIFTKFDQLFLIFMMMIEKFSFTQEITLFQSLFWHI